MNVAVRVDAGPVIGTGHWMRCLALARALRQRGASVCFLSRDPPPALGALLATFGIGLEVLPSEPPLARADPVGPAHAAWLGCDPAADARATVACIARRFGTADWVVVDHFGIDARWHRLLRPATRRLMAVDDLADRALDADLVVDQGYRFDAQDYAPHLSAAARVLPGVGHALLRDEFASLRESARERRLSDDPVTRVLISFGGVDGGNLGAHVLRALARDPSPELEIDVVAGAASQGDDALGRAAAGHPHRVTISRGVSDMARRMAQADVAFGACGFTSWERCCLALPAIVVAVADNQRAPAAALARTGAAWVVAADADDMAGAFASAWRRLRDDADLRARMAAAAAAACDGRGTTRVVHAMTEAGAWP